jgi:GNAT superfamily N-acetyltransferase
MPSTEVQIHLATLEEAPEVSRVLYESFREFEPLYTAAGFAATTPNADQIQIRMREGPVWIAHHRHNVVGTVAAVRKGESLYIRGMAVLPSARGLRIGACLLEYVEQWALPQTYTRLLLSTTPFLDAAIRLYENHGFRRVDDGVHDLFGTPLFGMEKHLTQPRPKQSK